MLIPATLSDRRPVVNHFLQLSKSSVCLSKKIKALLPTTKFRCQVTKREWVKARHVADPSEDCKTQTPYSKLRHRERVDYSKDFFVLFDTWLTLHLDKMAGCSANELKIAICHWVITYFQKCFKWAFYSCNFSLQRHTITNLDTQNLLTTTLWQCPPRFPCSLAVKWRS